MLHGFVLALPFHHGELEPDCVGFSTGGVLMCRIKVPLQDFVLKMQGGRIAGHYGIMQTGIYGP